jgi:hypothetical protein
VSERSIDPVIIKVTIEATARKAFARAIDWPGWSRSGKTEELALEALADAASRYAAVTKIAGERFAPGSFEVVDHVEGVAGTDFGIPYVITDEERRSVTKAEAARLARLVDASWKTLDRVAATAPAELRKGPRGGGRDRDKMYGHVVEADSAYAREIGLKLPQPDPTDHAAIEAHREAVLAVLREPSDGSPIAGRKWTARYAAGRIAWHALDHAWEMEDRSEPG